MPDTDSIAALLREVAEFGDHGGVSNYDLRQRARAALEHYRWRDKPNARGDWWLREQGEPDQVVAVEAWAGRFVFRKNATYSEWRELDEVDPDAEWCPALPPPPREGE